jgi:hypothetical protein
MCNILHIESYIIYGYSKGYSYVKGENFLKSNHAWNIIHADSNWIIIDANWGSGSLRYDYDMKSKIKEFFGKDPGIKRKVDFMQCPSDKYFDIAPNEACKTHFPIDSKWQLKSYPVTYKSFTTDSFYQSKFLNYEHEISFVRYRDQFYQIFTDALNSIKYNPYNKFDIAYQYYYQASQLNVRKKTVLDTILLKSLNQSQNYYDSSLVYLKDFRAISRNFYRDKKQNRKYTYRIANNALKSVRKIPTTFNDKYGQANRKILKDESILEKARLNVLSSDFKIPKSIQYKFDTVNTVDSALFREYISKINIDSLKVSNIFFQLTNTLQQIKTDLKSGQGHNDSIVSILSEISYIISYIDNSVDNMDEYEVFNSCKKLDSTLTVYYAVYADKKSLKNKLIQGFNTFDNKYQNAERSLISMSDTYEKLAKLTGDNKIYSGMTDSINNSLKKLYSLRIKTIFYIKQHYDSWKNLLSSQNEILSVYGANGLQKTGNKLTAFYDYISTNNEKAYLNNMKLYESINSSIKRNLSTIRETKNKINEMIRYTNLN